MKEATLEIHAFFKSCINRAFRPPDGVRSHVLAEELTRSFRGGENFYGLEALIWSVRNESFRTG
ncbi:MAG: hypothetical protein MI923_06510 [Phycisphaerales bacterium]|nr:hypothetical protein [Phycisphaerales bacterium]